MTDHLDVKNCWARGFSIKEAAKRSYQDERTVREDYEELEKEMREFFLKQKKETLCPQKSIKEK